jgi:hypothetical protein
MSTYLFQGCYTSAAIAAMVQKPEDRSVTVRGLIEGPGGKLDGFWLAVGEHDFRGDRAASRRPGSGGIQPCPPNNSACCPISPDSTNAREIAYNGILMATKRAITRIQVNGQAHVKLGKLCEKRGITQIAAISRMLSWFLSQDDTVHAIVLGSVSEEMLGPLAPKLLQQLADKAARK